MRFLIITILCFICMGCDEVKVENVNLGKLISAQAIPTSFNECPKTQVITDKGFYILTGYRSFEKGQEVIVNKGTIRY